MGKSPIEPPDPDLLQALAWIDPLHRTSEVRRLAENLQTSGIGLVCVWTHKPLTGNFDIDHCLPFSIWPNNDLWNLVPTSPTINRGQRGKFDRLVSAETLIDSGGCIQSWWKAAYLAGGLMERFRVEAETSLPHVVRGDGAIIDRVWRGLEVQRINLA